MADALSVPVRPVRTGARARKPGLPPRRLCRPYVAELTVGFPLGWRTSVGQLAAQALRRGNALLRSASNLTFDVGNEA